MNIYLFIAGILCFLLGIAHSILGEILIFKNKRKKGKLVPTLEGVDLKSKHLRILWATWHLASIFGWCLGATILKISLIQGEPQTEFGCFFVDVSMISMLASSLLVFFSTKGRHPGWVVLLAIGILLFVGK